MIWSHQDEAWRNRRVLLAARQVNRASNQDAIDHFYFDVYLKYGGLLSLRLLRALCR